MPTVSCLISEGVQNQALALLTIPGHVQSISCLPLCLSSTLSVTLGVSAQVMVCLSSHPFSSRASSPTEGSAPCTHPTSEPSRRGYCNPGGCGEKEVACQSKSAGLHEASVPGQMPLCTLRPIVTGSRPALTAGSFRRWDWSLCYPPCNPALPGPDLGRKRGSVLFLEWRLWETSQLGEG